MKQIVTHGGFDAIECTRLLDRKTICHRLGISRQTFIRWNNRGELPVVKIGGRWKMTERAFHDFINRKPARRRRRK